jgi:diaminopimelate decarboxylase
MKWGKDPKKRTKFGVWLDEKEIYQNEIVKASGLSNSIISALCNDKSYQPKYNTFVRLRIGLEKMGYQVQYEYFW